MSELERRLAAVETLAGHADREVADLNVHLRAQTSLMQALRVDQVAMNTVLGRQGVALGTLVAASLTTTERLRGIDRKLDAHDQKLADHDRRFDAVDQKLADHDQRFDAVDQRFDAVDQRLDTVDQRLDTVDQKLDELLRRLPPAS